MSIQGKRQDLLSHGPSGEEWEQAHQRIKDNREVWSRLQFQGITGMRGEVYEMRACPSCGSTVNKQVTLSDAVGLVADYCGVLQRSLAIMPALLPIS